MQIKGRVKEKWGRLTDDDLAIIQGRRDQLLGKVQELYQVSKEEAERELIEFLKEERHSEEKAGQRKS
jgi:uncharacterized protein YjbJ (UPF0337 family)